MKKKLLALILCLMVAVIAIAAEYHYAFMTSCGVTVYKSFPYELSDEQCLSLFDGFENTYCGRTAEPIL